MRRIVAISTFAVLLLAASPAGAADSRYGWTISDSTTDPLSNTGTATSGVRYLYLWLQCSEPDGMTAAEFDIRTNGPTLLGTNTKNGFLNAGSAGELLLAVGECPSGPVLAAELLVLDLPGTVCLAPSPHDFIVTVDCDLPSPAAWYIDWIGYTSAGGRPCSQGALCDSPLDGRSWGEVKAYYR